MDGAASSKYRGDDFRQRLGRGGDARLAAIVGDLVASVHDLVRKHRISRDELHAAIRFATDVGMATDEKRQEWVLLADATGLSDLVEKGAVDRPAGATPQTLLGPFFRDVPQRKGDGDTISLDGKGRPLAFHARIVDLDGEPVAGATVDVWQANADGVFENQQPDSQPEFNLRGRFQSGQDGRVTFRTVRPGGYGLPEDGPVAALLRALGLSLLRPAHIQFRIAAPGFQTLVTHVFDRDDRNIGADPLFCVAPELLTGFGETAAFTFKLARSRPGQSTN